MLLEKTHFWNNNIDRCRFEVQNRELWELADQATMPHGVIGCSDVHKDSTSLFLAEKPSSISWVIKST